jgi:hypothetical protein
MNCRRYRRRRTSTGNDSDVGLIITSLYRFSRLRSVPCPHPLDGPRDGELVKILGAKRAQRELERKRLLFPSKTRYHFRWQVDGLRNYCTANCRRVLHNSSVQLPTCHSMEPTNGCGDGQYSQFACVEYPAASDRQIQD